MFRSSRLTSTPLSLFLTNRTIRFCLLLLTFTLFLSTSQQTFAQCGRFPCPRFRVGDTIRIYDSENIRLYSNPSGDTAIVATLNSGAAVRVVGGPVIYQKRGTGVLAAYGYYDFRYWKVSSGSQTGWWYDYYYYVRWGNTEKQYDRIEIQPRCEQLDAKLRPGQRAKNSINLNVRDRASTSGGKLVTLGAGQVVDVLDGPVNANGYHWFKIRHGNVTGWAAESGSCKYWLTQTGDPVSKPTVRHAEGEITVGGRCTLHDAIEAANKDRPVGGCLGGLPGADGIRLDTDVALKSKLPVIESKIYIFTVGNNRSAISGENRYQIFEVAASGDLGLDGVTLRNGTTDRQGAAIVNNGVLFIHDSTIRNNHAKKDGGAFSNNGTMTVRNSAFMNNRSDESGGAIRNKGRLTIIDDSRFENNEAEEQGGAIRNKGELTVRDSRFAGNSGSRGGAIDHVGDSITLSGNTFSNNSPDNCYGDGVDCGDVPALDPNKLSIIVGGKLTTRSLPEGDDYDTIQLRLLNSATVSIRMTATSGNLVPGLSLFDDDANKLATDENDAGLNMAELEEVELAPGLYEISAWSRSGSGKYKLEVFDGGLPAADAQKVKIEAKRISYGEVKTGELNADIDSSQLVSPSPETHNYQFTATKGDNVNIVLAASVDSLEPHPVVKLLTVSGDRLAEDDPGLGSRSAIIWSSIIPADGDYLINVYQTGYLAQAYELHLSLVPDKLEVDGIVCTMWHAITAANEDRPAGSCPAGDGADTIYLLDNLNLHATPDVTSEITLEGAGFNINANGRGRIFKIAEGGNLTIKNVVLQGGAANAGGAIHNQGVLNASDCGFADNNASNNGGAIFNEGSMTISNCEFFANQADWGGAIMHDGSFAQVRDSEFIHNEAKGGGAIFNDDGRKMTVVSSGFVRNEVNDLAALNKDAVKAAVLTGGKLIGKKALKAALASAGFKGAAAVVGVRWSLLGASPIL